MSSVRLCPAAAAAAVLLLAGASTSAADPTGSTLEPGTLTVCLYPGFAPFSSEDADGRFIGWDVDYLQDFADSQGLRFQAVGVSRYGGIWQKPAEGVCDIAASGISDTPDRRSAAGPGAVWSRHYYSVLRALLVRSADADAVTGVDDLRGRTVIVTAESTADHDLRNRLARSGINDTAILFTADEEQAARQVLNAPASGEPFAYAGGLGSVEFLAAKLGGLAVTWPHCNMRSDGSEVQEPFSFVVRALSLGLADSLDRFIAANSYPGGPASDPDCPLTPPVQSR